MNVARAAALIGVAVVALAACGTGHAASGGLAASDAAAAASPSSPAGNGGGSSASGGGDGGGSVKGYDCATLLTPAELDAAAGLTGSTVTTTKRGDTPPPPGEVGGVTECAIDVPNASDWTGSFAVATGDEAISNFEAQMAIGKQQGATPLAGVGTDAVIHSGSDMRVNAWAKGQNGVDVTIGVAYDQETTNEAAVLAAVKQILTTVLSRT